MSVDERLAELGAILAGPLYGPCMSDIGFPIIGPEEAADLEARARQLHARERAKRQAKARAKTKRARKAQRRARRAA